MANLRNITTGGFLGRDTPYGVKGKDVLKEPAFAGSLTKANLRKTRNVRGRRDVLCKLRKPNIDKLEGLAASGQAHSKA